MPRPANAKDALLAWAYRFIADTVYAPVRSEFLLACRDAVPGVDSMISDLPATPLEAVQRAKIEQDRLVSEIWETKSDG